VSAPGLTYSDPDPAVREERFRRVCVEVAALMREGVHVFSPIAHSHPVAQVGELPTDFTFWQSYDEAMISRCSEVWVLTLPGWSESVGVREEIAIARRLGIPVRYVESVAAALEALGERTAVAS
jgi:hypothetical protein